MKKNLLFCNIQKKTLLSLLLFLLTSAVLFGQNISGTVKAANGENLPV